MNIVLSIKEKWAQKIYSGEKKIEWRKNAPTNPKFVLSLDKVFLYEVEKKIVTGWFKIGCIYGPLIFEKDITKYYEKPGCISLDELKKYSNKKNLYAWFIEEADKLGYPSEIKYFTPSERAPQSWCYTRAYFFNGTFNFDHQIKEFNK